MKQTKHRDDDPQWLQFYTHHIQPFWQQHVKVQQLTRPDGVTLAWYLYRPVHPKALVVISPGRIESGAKYQETLWDLAQAGYAVAIIDHRGQGLSERLTPNPHQGHVDNFHDYVADFAAMMQQLNVQYAELPKYLLAHSMGATIATLYLLRYPHQITRAAFSAPMFGIQLGRMPRWVAQRLVHAVAVVNRWCRPQRPWYVKGAGNYQWLPFASNELTHSAARYQVFRELYEAQPQLKVGGPTYRWVSEAFRAMHKVQQHAHELKVPLLILQAGGDTIVDNQMQQRFFTQHANPNSQLVHIDHAKHELLMETDRYRQPALDQILAWFQGGAAD